MKIKLGFIMLLKKLMILHNATFQEQESKPASWAA